MGDLVPASARASASTPQLILEHLCAVLLLISEGWRQAPAWPALFCVTLGGALVVVSLMVKRRRTSRRAKALGERRPARDEVCAGCGENTGPTTEADDALEPPGGEEAGPPWLQTLCLKALNKQLSRMLSLQDLADLVKTVRRSQPPRPSHVAGERPISEAPGTEGEQLQGNTPGDLNENSRHPESPALRQDEIMGWKQDRQEKEEEKGGPEQSTAPMTRVLQGRVSHSLSLAETPLQPSPRPEVLRGHLVHVKSQLERQREAESGDQSVRGLEGDLKGVPRDADLNASLPRADEEKQGTARQLREQRQRSEELAAEIARVCTENASLRCENTNLKAEIQQLTLKLQARPETDEDPLTQLHQQVREAEMRCFEMEKRFLNNWRNMNSTSQMLNTYKKMLQDMNQDLRRSASYYDGEVRYHQERAEGARMAAARAERELQELRRENDRSGQMLAKAQSTRQPFPGGPFAPAAPPAAHRGPEVPGCPLGPRVPGKEQGHEVGSQGSRRTCRFDLAPTGAGP